MSKKTINILFPVWNEEQRIVRGIQKTVDYMESHYPGQYVISIMNNGSTDRTAELADDLAEKYPTVRHRICSGKGVGTAFYEGVQANTSDIVGYMDIDLSTELRHLSDVMNLFQTKDVQLVNGSRLASASHTTGRKWYRNLTSFGLTLLLRLNFGLKASDSVCGFKFFDAEAARWLTGRATRESGWFFIIECLLRAEKSGMRIVELPVVWQDDWNSNLHAGKLIRYYLQQIWQLHRRLRKGESLKEQWRPA